MFEPTSDKKLLGWFFPLDLRKFLFFCFSFLNIIHLTIHKNLPWVRLFLLNECDIVSGNCVLNEGDTVTKDLLLSFVLGWLYLLHLFSRFIEFVTNLVEKIVIIRYLVIWLCWLLKRNGFHSSIWINQVPNRAIGCWRTHKRNPGFPVGWFRKNYESRSIFSHLIFFSLGFLVLLSLNFPLPFLLS